MTTSIEDNELEAELQELYLIGKQWISDLDFLEHEMTFLTTFPRTGCTSQVNAELGKKLTCFTHITENLRVEIQNFLKKVGQIAIAAEKKISISLIEDQFSIQFKLDELLQTRQKGRIGLQPFNLKPFLKLSDNTAE